jgi:hypothetical protein
MHGSSEIIVANLAVRGHLGFRQML